MKVRFSDLNFYNGLFKKETDPCEPDTKCSASGIYNVGNCKFG